MELFETKISDCLHDNLDNNHPSVEFDQVWKKYRYGKKRIFGLKRIIAMPLAAVLFLLVMLGAGFTYKAIIDKTDYPFVDDNRVIGKWQAFDFVKEINQFKPGTKHYTGDLYLNELVFIEQGRNLVSLNGSPLIPEPLAWTSGLVISKIDRTASHYTIKNINGNAYMFLEWKNGEYTFYHRQPLYYVLRQVDKNDYSNHKVQADFKDKIDYPFVDDPLFIGEWESVDLVENIGDFEPGVKSFARDLFLTRISVTAQGEISAFSSEGPIYAGNLSWTKDMVLNKDMKTASKYVIKELKGNTYLFYQWKDGDYIYIGTKPRYYVLKKV